METMDDQDLVFFCKAIRYAVKRVVAHTRSSFFEFQRELSMFVLLIDIKSQCPTIFVTFAPAHHSVGGTFGTVLEELLVPGGRSRFEATMVGPINMLVKAERPANADIFPVVSEGNRSP